MADRYVPDPIHMSLPDLDESDVRAVLDVLPTGRLSIGPKVEEFERAVAEYVGAPHAVAVSSGTAALHLAVKGLGIPVRAYFSPIHRQPYVRDEVGIESADLPVTDSVAGRTIALPFHNNLSEGEVERVVRALEEAVAGLHGSP